MKAEDALKEYVRLELISRKSKNPRYRIMAKSLLNRIESRHLFKKPSTEEISVLIKSVVKEPSSFHIILKRNIIREYGNMVYIVWSQDSRNNT